MAEQITIRYLSQSEVIEAGLTFAEATDLCTLSFSEHSKGAVENPPKPGVHPLPNAFVHAMPAYLKNLQVMGIKWVSGFPSNVPKHLPTIVGLIILNDCETGFPVALLDGTYITAIRTAAVSGVSAKFLARPDSEVLAIIGTGVQGKYHTLCMLNLLKNIKKIKIYDAYAPSIDRYVSEMKALIDSRNIELERASSCEEAITGADVIISATGALDKPIFFDKWVKPGALVLPVHRNGWNLDVLTKFDKIVTDDFAQFASMNKGHYVYAPFPDSPYAETGDVVTGKKKGRESDTERIICFNVGLAIHDMVIANKIVEKCKEKGLGEQITLLDPAKPLPLPPIA